jgi:CRISPR-associated protein Cpf1
MQLKDIFGIFDVAEDGSKDEIFYDVYEEINARFGGLSKLYDKVRNYLTQKNYLQDKIKLNFGNYQLFGGWDLNKEEAYRTVMLRKGDRYYVGIIDAGSKDIFENIPTYEDGPYYEKMIYKLLPGQNKTLPRIIFAQSNRSLFQPPKEITDKYDLGTHLSGPNFNLKDCHALIDYFKSCLKKYESWKCYDFHFSDTSTYKNISDFYKEVSEQGYKVRFIPIAESYINDCIEQGKLMLFQVYNKDFSEYSKGKKNLHTLYFTQLFSKENLADPIFLLNGGAEMFYRFANPKLDPNKVTHSKNIPVKNKNPLNAKKESVFAYDLIKDKRYTKAQFSFHVPIKINAFDGDSGNNKVGNKVRTALRKCDDNYVIGIDRGERNLLYICVIDGKGKIVEQFSANIVEDDSHQEIKTNYHTLLDAREKEREDARKSWKSINGIADLKNGYLSQVIHKICLLVEKYDAVIAMEDLNSGFKHTRAHVEKSVYQQFEKALTEKLNFLTFKDKKIEEAGGLRHAYQLTDKIESYKDMKEQNGIIFYIPAWNTSKIDPSTGFVDLLKPKYSNAGSAVEFFGKFNYIGYDRSKDMFAFTFDHADFGKTIDYKNKWTVYSYGDRIETFRTEANKFDCRTVRPTDLFKQAFTDAGIAYADGHNLVEEICAIGDAKTYVALYKALKFTLQMRNSNSKTGEDYIISPVLNKEGEFFDSRKYSGRDSSMPVDADANGAYHIAKKCLWAIDKIKSATEGEYLKTSISIKNQEWLQYMQSDR